MKPEIYEGLKIPTGDTKPIRKEVKEVVVEPKMTNDQIKAREGTYFKESEVDTIFDEDVDVFGKDPSTGEKRLLARFRKNVIPKDIIKLGWEAFYQTAAASRNRGAAAGPIRAKSAYWKKRKPVDTNRWSTRYVQNGKVSKMRVNNNVFSSVLGYFDKTPFMGLPCRLTSYTQKYFKQFQMGIPYIKFINKCFKELVPEAHAKQLRAARQKPMYTVDDTAFSSVTINRNFQTALHQDAGDFREGFGNLSVIERGDYEGGYTLFPQYGIGFNIRTGDFIAMDVHEWHCNTELTETAEQKKANAKLPKIHLDDESTGTFNGEKKFTRISFVCYLREKLRECVEKDTHEYYKKIGFSEKDGFNKKKNTTRKKK
jgi:Oxygenase domain of the 2OGFeDO superfamily